MVDRGAATMCVVPWTYNNPRLDRRKLDQQTFLFCGRTVTIYQDPEADIDHTKNTELKLWDGAFLLAKYIEKNYQDAPKTFWKNKSCLELGSGCGLVGLVAWMLGAHVTLTDLPKALTHTQKCVDGNLEQLDLKKDAELRMDNLTVKPLTWGCQNDLAKLKPPYDVILGSDIMYDPSATDDLLNTLTYLSDSKTAILLTYKPRGLGEHIFFQKLSSYSLSVEEIPMSCHPPEFKNSDYKILTLVKNSK